MTQKSTLSTFILFGRTSLRRLINRSAAMKFSILKKKSPDSSDVPVRTATRHRSDRTSLLRRLAGMWLPIMALVGMVGLSFNSMFVILGSVSLEESRAAAVLHISPDSYAQLKKAVSVAGKDGQATAFDEALNSAFSSTAAWQTSVGVQLAKGRFDEKGLAAFAPQAADSRWSGTLAYLSPEGRIRGMQAVGIYVAFVNLAMCCVAFGLMSKNLSGVDLTLMWLWQFPVSRGVLFSSKLIECVFDTPTVAVVALFYAVAVWICGASFFAGLGVGALLGISAGLTAAALRLGAETFMTQRLGRRTRGAIVAGLAAVGSTSMLLAMIGSNSQFVVESFIKLANALPAACSWNPFSAGIGSASMLNQDSAWWLAAPAMAATLAALAVLFAVRLTAGGLYCAQDSVRGSKPSTTGAESRRTHLSTVAWKELLQMRRQPEVLGQVLATPIGIGLLLYISGYGNVLSLATKGGANISVAILAGVSYMLMIAASQMLSSEFKTLWLMQCQPRPLADVVRSKARVWAAIALSMSVPFIGGAIALLPSEAASILVRVPFLLAALWLLSELVFGLTALAASVTNEQTVRFRRGALLPALVVSDLSLAIYSQNWWQQLGALATLAILNAAVRARQLDELEWLSEPVETPPKKLYPMHAVLTIVGFRALQVAITGAFIGRTDLSASAIVAISYCVAAIVVSSICWTWMSQNRLTMPKLARGPALRPICLGLLTTCTIGFAVTMCFRWWNIDSRLPAYAINGVLQSAAYDKWCLFGLWVVAAPLFEEWIIRGLLYKSLRRNWGIGLSVALSAILFATLHPAGGCIALLTLGTMTALAVEKTGRLWPSITIHAGYNFMIWILWTT